MTLFFLRASIFFIISALAIGAQAPSTIQEEPHSQKDTTPPIDLPAPLGEDMKGIFIPQYDAEGNPTMNFIAEKARKISEQELEVDSLNIQFFERDGKDVTVFVPHGIFHLDTKILSTDSEVTIKREDFEMVGESAAFNTSTRYGTMKGHVHTEIRNGIPAKTL
ncbi:MAG: hypothetical protein DVB29_01340 [Verrucomicrobia bacterium]|nr:MAG: hypothetical protein DVB29_01340 [Verrucomicrobiota bacterium]